MSNTGSTTLSLAPGTHPVFVGSSIGSFNIEVDSVGNVSSQNTVAATGSGSTLSFNTATISVDPANFALPGAVWFIVDAHPKTLAINGATPVTLVRGIDYNLVIGSRGFVRFSVGADGTVTTDNPAAVLATGTTLTFNTTTINVDPAGFANAGAVWFIFDTNLKTLATTGLTPVTLVPAVNYLLVIGSRGFIDVSVDASGNVASGNPVAVNAVGNTLSFNTTTIDVNPDGFAGAWQIIDVHPKVTGPASVVLVPGFPAVDYKIVADIPGEVEDSAFTVGDPCIVTPSALTLIGFSFALSCGAHDPTDYYVDSVGGDDASGNGAESAPWQSLAKINALLLFPDDHVFLKRGSVFHESLLIIDSGTMTSPIVVDAYGAGANPVISAGHFISQDAGWVASMTTMGEYSLTLGSTATEFVTSAAVLVRAAPTGIDTYRLLARGSKDSLAVDTYAAPTESGLRVIHYRPPVGTHPDDFEFELSKHQAAIVVLGDYVRVGNVQAILGNQGNPNADTPLGIPTYPAVIYSEGAGVEFHDCHAAFGRSRGIAVTGPDSLIDECTAEQNHSTGLYILGAAATGSAIRNSIARFNGNLETGDLDRGGIGVQSSATVISDNIVHDNGNITDTTGPRVAGDDAIAVFDSNDVLVEGNFIYSSARGAIGASNTPNSFDHRIIGNVIYNWNLVGPACEAVASCENVRRSAIDLFGWGDTANSGRHTVWNNTIYSDQIDSQLFGIQLRTTWQSLHTLQDTSVLNNAISLPDNSHPDTIGIRMTGGHLYFNVDIDYNDVYIPNKPDQKVYSWLDAAGQKLFATALEFSENAVICGTDPGTQARCDAENDTRLYEFSGLNADPELNLALANPADPARYDLTIASPLINAGTDVGLTADFLGRSVPFSLAPDIGAFESRFDCQDSDMDGVCDSQDLCAAGPIIVNGLQAPLGPLSLEGDDPVTPDKAFKQNRTLPLKLTLSCGGVVLGDADIPAPTISEVALAGQPLDLPTIDLDAGDANDGGVSFRFSDDVWVYNLSTRGLDPGTYVVSVATPEDVRYTAAFVLR